MEYKDLIIPRLDVNDDKVTIEGIRFKNMDYINEGDILYSVETSKAVEDYEVDFSGYVVLYIGEGDEVRVGESAGMIFKNKEQAKKLADEIKLKKEAAVTVNASKKALAYAAEIGFDITKIKKDGIIKVEDINNFLKTNK